MATIPSSFNRFQPSSISAPAESGILVTTVTPRRPIPTRLNAARAATLFPMPKEPEDARLTGGTRSLDRRLLALNLSGSLPMREIAKPTAAPERIAVPRHSSAA
jgi:hypothetical protein